MNYAVINAVIFLREKLLYDTVIFWSLLKHTVTMCICQIPLQFGGIFANTHPMAQNGKIGLFDREITIWQNFNNPLANSFFSYRILQWLTRRSLARGWSRNYSAVKPIFNLAVVEPIAFSPNSRIAGLSPICDFRWGHHGDGPQSCMVPPILSYLLFNSGKF
jgi:hypothetical protein